MDKEFQAFTDGTYVFQETEENGKFFFYRKDGEVLKDIDHEPMDMYQNYLCLKMMSGEIDGAVFGNINYKISNDGKCMLLETSMEKFDVEPIVIPDKIEEKKKTNPVKRLIKTIFNSKNK